MNIESNYEQFKQLEEESGVNQENFAKKYLFTHLKNDVISNLDKESCDPIQALEFLD